MKFGMSSVGGVVLAIDTFGLLVLRTPTFSRKRFVGRLGQLRLYDGATR